MKGNIFTVLLVLDTLGTQSVIPFVVIAARLQTNQIIVLMKLI